MKFIIAIPDGASDMLSAYPDGRTPLQQARTPMMDELADSGEVLWARNVPDHLHPGSDVACLSIFGYDPTEVYTGRAPLEAASMGISLGNNVAFRCNLVTIENEMMKEFNAGHISTEEADLIIQTLNENLASAAIRFHTGVQYRHILVAPPEYGRVDCTPPHDILDQGVESYLPQGESKEKTRALMDRSREILADHPVNARRTAAGKPPASQIWLWGQGTAPRLESHRSRYGKQGAVISAVDLIKGIGKLAGLEIIEVEGATGLPDTNYEGKADAALAALETNEYVIIHVESTDEMGHKGDEAMKIRAIQDFDQRMLARVIAGLRQKGEAFRVLLLPDHPTPISLRTHTKDPVPCLLYDSRVTQKRGTGGYSEEAVRQRTQRTEIGHRLLDSLFER
ncbi:MAG: cofactor-independent phosphoglycerate mutase [Candidatus Omnitrophota bacterium]|jgi:2,3-bisphosphoglycerate-independent phosphoglycerate mutase|nr:MAG: cofactor-independent phosphoglycerate mutase [Candidatus Omnitrophota bacterium]